MAEIRDDGMTNATVAARLREVATLLEDQGANPFRVRAYRDAADTVRALDRPLVDLLAAEGLAGLDRLPGIGPRLAASIRDLAVTGRLPLLDRLRGEGDPVALLMSVPGIGPTLAARLHDELEIDSLEALEAAAYDGRLDGLRGFGARRLAAIRDVLAVRLGARRQQAAAARAPEPPVGDLLAVDREYRARAAAGTLPRIAPRRHNPEGRAWLPVLHTESGGRHYTALFSDTPRAHALGRTRDWVVLHYDGAAGERQCTVVTQRAGPLRGRRVVRGREAECAEYFREHPHAA